MKLSLTNFLINKANISQEDIRKDDPVIRSRFGYLEGWVSLLANFLLFVLKLIMGILSGSISIIADAVHTLSDAATSAVVIWGFKISKQPADKDHPFGHGRMEDISTLIIAVLLCVVGFEILKYSLMRLSQPIEVKTNWLIVAVLIFGVITKEWMARFSFFLAKKINSSTLFADAWHHRSDAISTLLVIAAIIASMHKVYKLDGFFGAIVAIYIIYTGAELIKDSTYHLLGKAADKELSDKIRNVARSVEGVEGVHDIIAHDYGNFKAISLHVEVASTLDSVQAHEIATSVETQIAKNIQSSPIVHIDLKRQKKRKRSRHSKRLEQIIKNFPQVISFHGIELLSNESGDFLGLHIIVPKVMNIEQSHQLEHKLKRELGQHFKEHKINIHVEPCDSKCKTCPQSCKDI